MGAASLGVTANANHLHVKRLRSLRNAAAGLSQPDNQQCAALEHQALNAVLIKRECSAFDDSSMLHDQPFGATEQQRHGMLHDRGAVCSTQVRHPDSATFQ